MKTSDAQEHEPIDAELSNRIRSRLVRFREEAGISREEIALSTGLSASGVRKMEAPGSNPTIQTLHAYVTACGRTLGEFFEPWLPHENIKYDNRIHRTIRNALKTLKGRAHVESFVAMLEDMKA